MFYKRHTPLTYLKLLACRMEVYSFINVYSLTGMNFKVTNADVQEHNSSTESESNLSI